MKNHDSGYEKLSLDAEQISEPAGYGCPHQGDFPRRWVDLSWLS